MWFFFKWPLFGHNVIRGIEVFDRAPVNKAAETVRGKTYTHKSLCVRLCYGGLPHYHKSHDLTPLCVCVCVGHYTLYRLPYNTLLPHGTCTRTHIYALTPTSLKGGGIDFPQKAPIQSYLLDLLSDNSLPTWLRCLWPGWPRWHFTSFALFTFCPLPINMSFSCLSSPLLRHF